MNFKKKFLSCLLAGTCLCSPSKKEETQGMEIIVGGVVIASVVGLIGYAIYREYQNEKARKAELQRRQTLLSFTNAPETVTKIARNLIYKIPLTSMGNSMFDSLLACKNYEDISQWSGLVAANSDWNSSTLDSICCILSIEKEIDCEVLKEKVKSKRFEEQKEADRELKREEMWQKERIANRKIYSKERENEKDREHDEKKQIRQHIHEHTMQDKQHQHENYQNDKKIWGVTQPGLGNDYYDYY